MIFKFHCTCGQKVSASDDMVGTAALCPRCGSRVIVPPPPEAAQPSPQTPQSPQSPQSPPSPPPTPAPPKSPAVSAPPMSVVPRPMGLLWLAAYLTVAVVLGTGGFLFRGHWNELVKNALPVLLGVAVGETILAILLRLAVRIVARFDLAFLEALLVTIVGTALISLAMTPVPLVRFGILRPEEGARLLPVFVGAGLLFTLVTDAYLIRNPQGRPIGIGRGILSFLLQWVFAALVAGLVFLAVTRVWPST